MTFYIKVPGDIPESLFYDKGILGETTKTIFYPDRGFFILTKLIEFGNEELLEEVEILDETGKHITIDKFLLHISKLKIAKFNN